MSSVSFGAVVVVVAVATTTSPRGAAADEDIRAWIESGVCEEVNFYKDLRRHHAKHTLPHGTEPFCVHAAHYIIIFIFLRGS